VKAGCKQSNWLAEISHYIGKRRKMEDRNSVPTGSSVGWNEPPVLTGLHTQPSKPTEDKYRISRTSNPTDTNISKEPPSSMFTEEALKTEAAGSSEKLVSMSQTTKCNI
jgi:hypothetical protein